MFRKVVKKCTFGKTQKNVFFFIFGQKDPIFSTITRKVKKTAFFSVENSIFVKNDQFFQKTLIFTIEISKLPIP